MFIIVRHGNTFEADEPPRRIGARTDLPLTARGIGQAQALGEYFVQQGWTFSRTLVSPLLRTRQTAQAILGQQAEPPTAETCDFLREVDHGPDEDKTEYEVLARLGAGTLTQWEQRAIAPPGWIVEPDKRIAGWQQLFADPAQPKGAVLLVTSNGAARFALMAEPALRKAAAQLSSLKLPTGSFGSIVRDANGALQLDAWGIRP